MAYVTGSAGSFGAGAVDALPLLLATARTLRALLTHLDDGVTVSVYSDLLAGLDHSLKPFQPSDAAPVNEKLE
jgi:hypothetical protein